jgi:hypothetical protein
MIMCGKEAVEIKRVPCQIAAGHVSRELLLPYVQHIPEGGNEKSKHKLENGKDYFS